MMIRLRKFATVCALVPMLVLIPAANAQGHVIAPAELDRVAQEAAQTRQNRLQRIGKFFSSTPVQNTLAQQGLSSEQVSRATMFLDDEELDRLAGQVDEVENQFAAGDLSNEQLTYLVIALVAAVIVLIAVAA